MLNLGLFMMPLHPPARELAQVLREDRELAVLADRCGFSEVWMGEHFTSTGEPVTSPLIFNASLIDRAPNIRLASGVLCLPQQHPLVIAQHVALLDQMSGGRVIFGIGSGGLASDWEVFDNLDHAQRGRDMIEAVEAIQRLWTEDTPIRHDGGTWQFAIEERILPELGVGKLIKPLQKPHPPIAVSLRGRNSGLAVLAGERGWIPISGNFIDAADIATHWPRYLEGAENQGREADPDIWRVGRTVLLTESDSQADDLLADPGGVFADYYYYLGTHLKLAMGELDETFDPAAQRRAAVETAQAQVIAGTRARILDQLVAFHDTVGDFGTLVLTGHDTEGMWDMWENTFRAMADDIGPALGRHMGVRR